jgi:hypothetical protein
LQTESGLRLAFGFGQCLLRMRLRQHSSAFKKAKQKRKLVLSPGSGS